MQAFYFGESGRPLFGALHEPVTAPRNPRAVVVCAPLWQEALRAHRALRQVSVRLAKAGLFALRFDYYGAGDSGGDIHEGDVNQWLADVATAVDEAKKAKGLPRVTLLGLRFGASLAALAAAERSDVESLVLWEPVLDGKQHLDEGMAAHRAWNDTYRVWRSAHQTRTWNGNAEMQGFPITEAMRRSVSSVDLTRLPRTAPTVLLVERESVVGGQQLKEHLVTLGARVDHEVVPEPEIWKSQELDQAVVPRQTLDRIVTWLGRNQR